MRISDWSSDVCSSDLVGEAYASIDSLTWQMIVVLLITTGATLALGAFVGASFAKPIVRLTGAMKELAGGNNRVEIPNAKRGDRSEERRVGNACVSTCRSRW